MKKIVFLKLLRIFIFSAIILSVIIYRFENLYDNLNFANSLFIDISYAAAIVGIFIEIYKKK